MRDSSTRRPAVPFDRVVDDEAHAARRSTVPFCDRALALRSGGVVAHLLGLARAALGLAHPFLRRGREPVRLAGRLGRCLLGGLRRLVREVPGTGERLVRRLDRRRRPPLREHRLLLGLPGALGRVGLGPLDRRASSRLLGEALVLHPVLGVGPRALDVLRRFTLGLRHGRGHVAPGGVHPGLDPLLGLPPHLLDVTLPVSCDCGRVLGVGLGLLGELDCMVLTVTSLVGGVVGLGHQPADGVLVHARHRLDHGPADPRRAASRWPGALVRGRGGLAQLLPHGRRTLRGGPQVRARTQAAFVGRSFNPVIAARETRSGTCWSCSWASSGDAGQRPGPVSGTQVARQNSRR